MLYRNIEKFSPIDVKMFIKNILASYSNWVREINNIPKKGNKIPVYLLGGGCCKFDKFIVLLFSHIVESKCLLEKYKIYKIYKFNLFTLFKLCTDGHDTNIDRITSLIC